MRLRRTLARTPLMHIYLIGYRGTGKSTLGPRLAEALQRPFVDADADLEQHAQQTIADIFRTQGESHFRDLETLTLRRLAEREPSVIATGGGSVLRETNRQLLRSTGFVVWLQATAETIFQRILRDPTTAARRPNLTVKGGLEEIQQLLTAREPFYAATAHFTIATEAESPETLLANILSAWSRI